ncbi:c-type cytochrome [Paracoccus ravus]|uniref:c-type cytochrome n=1 Tax=Paracoccus ravus TaxID=2447760 RepID=UPI00142F5E5B|nr:cytochrome c [Paracoccus ravus]
MLKLLAAAAGLILSGSGAAFAADPAQAEALFSENCAACHNEGGIGTPGFAPPLNRPGFWAGLGDQATTYISAVTTHGLNGTITAAGEKYIGLAMPGIEGPSDEEMAAINSWVLGTLGETDKVVTAEDIAAAKAQKISAADLRAMRPKTE